MDKKIEELTKAIKNNNFENIIFIITTIVNIFGTLKIIQELTINIKFIIFIIINIVFIWYVKKYDNRKLFSYNLSLIIFAYVLTLFSYYGICDTIYYVFDYKWLIEIFLSFSNTECLIVFFILFIFYFLTLKYIVYNENRKDWIRKDKIRNIFMTLIMCCSYVSIYWTFYNIFFVNKEIRVQKIYNDNGKEKVLVKKEGNSGTLNECKIYKDIGKSESIIIFKETDEYIDLKDKKTKNRNFRKVEER